MHASDIPYIIVPAILSAIISYLLGSLNFSIILTKLKHDDVRKYGSGNAGMTNMLRVYGKGPAVATFVLDFLKCAAAILIARAMIRTTVDANLLSVDYVDLSGYVAGYACMLGHMFPIYFGFRGGKGVVTSTALMLFIDWRCFIAVIAVFLIIFVWKKIISLGSIIGAAVYPISTFLFTYFFDFYKSPLANHGDKTGMYVILVTLLSVLVGATIIIKHHANIKRLIDGTEKPITAKKA